MYYTSPLIVPAPQIFPGESYLKWNRTGSFPPWSNSKYGKVPYQSGAGPVRISDHDHQSDLESWTGLTSPDSDRLKRWFCSDLVVSFLRKAVLKAVCWFYSVAATTRRDNDDATTRQNEKLRQNRQIFLKDHKFPLKCSYVAHYSNEPVWVHSVQSFRSNSSDWNRQSSP